MAQASERERIDELELIVDADAHVRSSVDMLLPYIDDRYDGARRRMADSRNQGGHIFSNTFTAPPDTKPYHSNRSTGEIKLEEMVEFDIDVGILIPSLMNAINTVNNPRYAIALANGYNAWMADEFLDPYDEFKAAIVVAPQKPDVAAEEIDDRAGEEDFVAVAVTPGALFPPIGHERYDPIYQAAVDNDLPITLHTTNNAYQSSFPEQYRHSETYYESHVISHPFTMMWNLCTAIIKGLPERFPGIELVFQEAGIGWIPYFKWRLDDIYLESSEEVPWLRKLPSEYIDESCYFTTQPLGHTAQNPNHYAMAVEMTGPENIMYSSDLPHPTFDPPRELYTRLKGHFDAETVEGIMGRTAERVFGL